MLRKEEEATGAPVEEATGTEEAEVVEEVAEHVASEPPPPQGMKAAKWSGMLVDNRPPFIFHAAMRSSEPLSAGRKRMVAHFENPITCTFRLSHRRCACILHPKLL